ncbi:hypothetical protein DIPPA_17671 [Diplonema papillatum]|nr:hypothetical protein DIPPA_17671 [Diplonema papillatum]
MHVVFVATDLFGQKVNYELEFPTQPTVAELIRYIEAVFTMDQQARRPGFAQPYKVAKLNVVDEVSEGWVEVTNQSQLRNYCQVYAFQPHSTQLTESQGHIPAATKPLHLPSTSQPVQDRGPSPPLPQTLAAGVAQVKLLPQDASHDEKVRACFEGLDANGNRVLELDEMKRGFQMFGIDITTGTVDDLFHRGDVDRDGVIAFPEWQRFAELYPTLLDSLYYRLKSHWEIVAGKNELDQFAALQARYVEGERMAKAAFDQTQVDIEDAERRAAEADRAAAEARTRHMDSARAAEEARREVEAAAQRRHEREHALAGERERERQSAFASQHSARDVEAAQQKMSQVQLAIQDGEAAERRAAEQLALAQRELQRLRALGQQAHAEVQTAVDRHNRVLSEHGGGAEACAQALMQADQELALADARQHDLAQMAAQAAAQAAELARVQDDAQRTASLVKERQEPMRSRWLEARQAIDDHARHVSEREGELASEISQKRLLHAQEKSLVDEEIRLRAQRETLEVKEGALRDAHLSFFKPALSVPKYRGY